MANGKTLILQIRLTQQIGLLALLIGLLCINPLTLGSEIMTLTTYYPAPYGAYVAILTTNRTLLARDGGNVGIGIAKPLGKLHVEGNGNVIFNTLGGVGIGTTNPQAKTGVTDGDIGYLDVKDVWLRDVNMWASELGGRLPDTGQQNCYNETESIPCPSPGAPLAQDGSYKPIDTKPDFTNNSNGTITDNQTGLMWKRCTEPDTTTDCTGTHSFYTWTGALGKCEGLTYAGYADWRLPNYMELASLVRFPPTKVSESPPGHRWIDTTYFPNIVGYPDSTGRAYWSSTTEEPSPTKAMAMQYDDYGCLDDYDKTDSANVLCVRGGTR